MDEWVRRWVLRLVVVIVTAFVLTVGWLVFDGLNDSKGEAACTVVVGDSLGPDQQPSAGTQTSLNHVADLLKKGETRRVIVAAQAPAGEVRTIEDSMIRYLSAQGAPIDTVMRDANGDTPETTAADVAASTNPDGASVLLVADYAQVTRYKLALREAGVGTVATWHSGTFNANDLPSLATTALVIWRTVLEKHVVPEAKTLVSETQSKTHEILSKTKQEGAEEARKSVKSETANTNAAH